MRIHSALRNLTVVLFVLLACLGASGDSAYKQSIEKWRQDYQASLKADDGWLTVSGLFWLHEGKNTFGSAAGNDVVLPAPVPEKAGDFELHAGKVTVHINAGSQITMNGKPVTTAELQPDVKENRLVTGDLTFFVHTGGDNHYAIRLKDKNSKLRKTFTGLHWYPVNEHYNLNAHYTAYPKARTAQIGIVHGGRAETTFIGYITYSLDGKEYRLDATEDKPGNLFIVFRDLTSKTETYQAARFLDEDIPKDGKLELDFNKAYNPPCAYNPYTTCPLPSPGNRLLIAIPAGEKRYHD